MVELVKPYRVEFFVYTANTTKPLLLGAVENFVGADTSEHREKGIKLKSIEGNKWQIELELPTDSSRIEYKYIETSADPFMRAKKGDYTIFFAKWS